MHDGRFADLEQVLSFYSNAETVMPVGTKVGQRERTLDLIPHLDTAQQSCLIHFLRTLTAPRLPATLERAPSHPQVGYP